MPLWTLYNWLHRQLSASIWPSVYGLLHSPLSFSGNRTLMGSAHNLLHRNQPWQLEAPRMDFLPCLSVKHTAISVCMIDTYFCQTSSRQH